MHFVFVFVFARPDKIDNIVLSLKGNLKYLKYTINVTCK